MSAKSNRSISLLLVLVILFSLGFTTFGQIPRPVDKTSVKVTSSSFNKYDPNWSENRYLSDGRPELSIDGDHRTGWKTDKPLKSGWIEFTFKKDQVFARIQLLNGSWWNSSVESNLNPRETDESQYRLNNRIEKYRITLSNGQEIVGKFNDKFEVQVIELPLVKTNKIKLTIESYIKGSHEKSETSSVGISEVSFFKTDLKFAELHEAIIQNDFQATQKLIKRFNLIKKVKPDYFDLKEFKINGINTFEYLTKNSNLDFIELLLDTYTIDITSIKFFNENNIKSKIDIKDYAFKIQNIKKEYLNDLKTLESNALNFDEIKLYRAKLREKYKDLTNIQQLNFEKLLSAEEESRFQIEAKSFKVKANEQPKELRSLPKLRNLESQFMNKYYSFRFEPAFKETVDFISKKQVNIMKANEEKLYKMIQNSKTRDELNLISREYVLTPPTGYNNFRLSREVSYRETYFDKIERDQYEAEEKKKRDILESQLKNLGYNTNFDKRKYSSLFRQLILGNKEKLDIKRNSIFFDFTKEYAASLALVCKGSPNFDTQIIEKECERETVTTNGFGVEIGRTCVQYREVPTGLFIPEDLMDALLNLQKEISENSASNVLGLLAQMAQGGGIDSMIADARTMSIEIKEFLDVHGCDNAAVKRFQENLIRFLNYQDLIRLVD